MLAALELGVDDFDASVGGLGGCPYAPGATGNIATEELVHMVEDMGVATGVDLEAMIDAAAEAERIVGRELPVPGAAGRPADPDNPGVPAAGAARAGGPCFASDPAELVRLGPTRNGPVSTGSSSGITWSTRTLRAKGRPVVDPWQVSGRGAAVRTSRIDLGTMITPLPAGGRGSWLEEVDHAGPARAAGGSSSAWASAHPARRVSPVRRARRPIGRNSWTRD